MLLAAKKWDRSRLKKNKARIHAKKLLAVQNKDLVFSKWLYYSESKGSEIDRGDSACVHEAVLSIPFVSQGYTRAKLHSSKAVIEVAGTRLYNTLSDGSSVDRYHFSRQTDSSDKLIKHTHCFH